MHYTGNVQGAEIYQRPQRILCSQRKLTQYLLTGNPMVHVLILILYFANAQYTSYLAVVYTGDGCYTSKHNLLC